MSNVWRATDEHGNFVEFLSRDGFTPGELIHEHGLELPILIVDLTDNLRPVAAIRAETDPDAAFRWKTEWSEVERLKPDNL